MQKPLYIHLLFLLILMHTLDNRVVYAKTHPSEILYMRFNNRITAKAKKLDDIVIINGKNNKEVKRLLQFNLNSYAKVDEIISKEAVLSFFKNKTQSKIIWYGTTKAFVQPGENLPLSHSERAIQNKIKMALLPYSQDISITPLMPLKDDIGYYKININLSLPLKKRLSVELYSLNNKQIRWYKIKAFKPVLVAKNKIDPKETFNHHNVTLKRMDITGLHAIAYNTLSTLKNKRAKKNIRPVEIITNNNSEDKPCIAKGDNVKVHIIRNHIKLTVDSIAINDARCGKPVTLLNPRSQEKFNALTLGKKRAFIKGSA